jgi:GT2 family glycosyltransferase
MDDFLSGEHGHVAGRFRRPLRLAADQALDALLALSGVRRRLRRLAAVTPARDVLVAAVHGPDAVQMDAALAELARSRHRTRFATGSMAELGGGKFQNLNLLLADGADSDWLLVVDDDVALPPGFLDGLVAVAERLRLDLAQPAQSLASHAAWRFARRRPLSVARETNFVEIGPVTLFSRRAARELLPFPDLRFGWGLDAHWAALAAERGWRLGVVDALPVRHEARQVAAGYGSGDAVAEARAFLAQRPYVPAAEAGRSSRVHRRVPA